MVAGVQGIGARSRGPIPIEAETTFQLAFKLYQAVCETIAHVVLLAGA